MDQSSVLTAQIVVTVLVVAAFGLSLGAGLSALVKWRVYRNGQRDYDTNRARAEEFMERQRRELGAFTQSHPATEYDASFAARATEAKEAGFAPKTAGEFDLDNFVGERPKESYQAPGEVWVGLAALVLATIASILDVWLT